MQSDNGRGNDINGLVRNTRGQNNVELLRPVLAGIQDIKDERERE